MNRTIISRPVYCLLSKLSNRSIENNNVVYNIVQSDIILNVDFARSVALQSTHVNLAEATYTVVIDRVGEQTLLTSIFIKICRPTPSMNTSVNVIFSLPEKYTGPCLQERSVWH